MELKAKSNEGLMGQAFSEVLKLVFGYLMRSKGGDFQLTKNEISLKLK